MKILASDLTFLSEHQWDQMDDAFVNEKSSRMSEVEIPRQQNRLDMPPMVLVDRISISHHENRAYQSNYSASVSAWSQVTSDSSQTPVSYKQQSAMEKLVGGMLNKDVIIGNIQRGEDVVLRDGDSIRSSEFSESSRLSRRPGIQAGIQLGSQAREMSLKQVDIHFEEENLAVSSKGQVMTEDGRTIDFSLDISLDRTFVSRTEKNTLIQRWQQAVNLTDPLVVSLDGKTPHLSDALFEFDLDSDGKTEQINFAGHGSGFLAFDKNNDQIINDGSELFGPGTGNGFGELAVFDADGNKWIDENDAVFSKLSVWTRNENGQDHLISLKDAGIGAIALDYASGQFNLTHADNSLQGQMKNSGVFLFEDGKVGSIHQIDLVSHTQEAPEMKKAPVMQILPRRMDVNFARKGLLRVPVEAEEPQEVISPLKELQEKIKKLKEEMSRLYEKINFTTPDRRRQKGIRQYQSLNLDTTLLFPGYQNRRPFPGSRYF